MRISLKIFVILLFFIFSSCSTEKKELTVVDKFNDAFEILKDQDYFLAAEEFEKVSDEFAFSSLAPRAKMMSIYSYYMASEYEEVVNSGDDFKNLFPSHKYSPYILYLQGLSYFDQIPQVDRAQDDSRLSSSIFRELAALYPESKYYQDSKMRIKKIDEFLAGSFLSKSRYFMNSEKYVSAIKNLQQVVMRYSHTKSYCEANFRMIEVFYKMGIDQQIKPFARNLKAKCQGGIWFNKGQKIILEM